MNKADILKQVRHTLGRGGFLVSEEQNIRSMVFDVVARKDQQLLLVKVLLNVGALSKDGALELVQIARLLKASPIVVGRQSGTGVLEDGVVYTRMGIPIITGNTLDELVLEGVPPFVFAAPGGFYVHIDGEALQMAKDERNLSLGTLAEIAGVSRRTISMYTRGMGAILEVAMKLEDFLNTPLVLPIDPFIQKGEKTDTNTTPFTSCTRFQNEIFSGLFNLGYDVVPVVKCPFDALTSDEKVLFLTGLEEDKRKLKRKAVAVSTISTITERDSVIFVSKCTTKPMVEGIPLLSVEELNKIDDPSDLEEAISKRKRERVL